MPRYFAALTIVVLLGMVLSRVFIMKSLGIKAMHFASADKKEFLIPPFAFFYFYIIFAAAFDLPTVGTSEFFHSDTISWVGVMYCMAGLLLLLWSIISFGKSFRVGSGANFRDQCNETLGNIMRLMRRVLRSRFLARFCH